MSSEPKAADAVEDVLALIDDYWCLAYAEGKEGRTHDTAQGDAQRCLSQIKQALSALRAEVEALRKDAERFRWLQGDPASRNLLDSEWPWCVYIDRRDGVPTMMPASGVNLAAAIDAAMENPA